MRYYHTAAALLLSLAFTPNLAAQSDGAVAETGDGIEIAEVEVDAETEEAEEPLNIAGFMAGLFGEEDMSAEDMQNAVEAASAYPLGSEQNPVRVDGPPGERAYLGRLRCDNLKRPKFERLGSGGMSPFGGFVDLYQVECKDSEPAKTTIFMDMYHSDHFEDQPVPGFGIVGGRRPKD